MGDFRQKTPSDFPFVLVFYNLASLSQSRPRRMIAEEESDEGADPYNPWTPSIYTGHELDFDTPAMIVCLLLKPVSLTHLIGGPVDRNSNKGKGPKMTCIYSQLQFDEDELERELKLAPELLFDQDENDFDLEHEEPMCRKRKRNSLTTYSKITEGLLKD
ncbi:hypothetical protein BX616_008971 [Lobosporangium transversale]|uniref:Uncharacterized protein n=1 Tax=Lobosporangium transversale TaxID=64571 RepID=A0A1Y2GYZ2_9FUNG|nr:hypothetical protein BCR41DRAFT_420070 [Lobosporangium transversale]KAF9914102.1 hypothetical protein BX616_008971 [Lobosporangium transversale]ORZ24806.1 hypothetical protein BCR41DRAFT_420070 [Lobosporangium transversale]|eukprot:XP_021883787.1 hypothetical protein BCR41DRAFT_420070 [Lobosporangium transversale]